MLQIVVWSLAGLLVIISTLPMFIVRSGGAAAGRGWAITVLACGIGFALFLFYASAEQAGAFSRSTYDVAPISPSELNNPFTTP